MASAQGDFLSAGEQAGARYALRLPRQAIAGGQGSTLAQHAGSSLEFKDYREYQAGDDLRHIDWNAYARSDQLSVKVFREEVQPHVEIIVDRSQSMSLENTAKLRATLGLAAFFASAAAGASFAHVVWTMSGTFAPLAGGTAPPTRWEEIAFDHKGGPDEALARSRPPWRSRGFRILLSDLLWEGDPLTLLRPLTDRAAVAIVVQILAESDVRPNFDGDLRLVDVETGLTHEIHIDEAAKQRYRDGLARHQQNWHTACRQTGAVFASVTAEDVVRDWKLDALIAADVLKVS